MHITPDISGLSARSEIGARRRVPTLALVAFCAVIPLANALEAQAHTALAGAVAGVVRDAKSGLPVTSANVFILGTLAGAITDSSGRFSLPLTPRPTDTLIVKRLGYREARLAWASAEDHLEIDLQPESVPLERIMVRAGRYAASDEPGAVLTPLEIVTIPGTAADVNRAIQTLPGVQQVDDGTGLYVRGGDYTETRVYLNDGRLLNPVQLQNSAGTFVGTLDPFLLDAVDFSSGGFGARYGDALSGIVALHTQRRPDAYTATLSAGLGAVGINAAAPGPHGTGIRLVADENNLSPVLRLNGSPRQFTVAPRGGDRTLSLFWNYRPTAVVSAFATDQRNRVATLTVSPSVSDAFATETRDRALVATWSDVFGPLAPEVVVSSSSISRDDDYGSFHLSSPSRLTRITAATDLALAESIALRTGLELGTQRADLEGSVPASGSDQSPNARVRLYDEGRTARASAVYQEIDWNDGTRLRVTGGYRYDRSSSTLRATLDPRLSGAYKISHAVALTAAWGFYRQAVDPTLQTLAPDSGVALPAMRARHAIVGVQVGDATPMLRIEAYDKSYRDLAAPNRDFVTVAGGTGAARGVDLIARLPVLGGVNARVVYSYLHSRRTDPSSGAMAPAPADVTHGLTIIGTRVFGPSLTLGTAFRYAGGRPFTPVVSATRASVGDTWTPLYGLAGSDRLPAYARLDLSANIVRVVTTNIEVVGYAALMNAFDRANVFTRQYTADYNRRYDVASIFNRSLYFGGVLTVRHS